MHQLHTWQPLSMCRQNFVRGRLEDSLHQEWFSQSKCLELLPHVGREDCEDWWLSSCCSSVAEHWLHKPDVLDSIPGNCCPFHFPLISLHYSKTSNNGPSEKRTTSVQRTAHLPPIDFTIELIHFEPPRSGHLSTPNNGH